MTHTVISHTISDDISNKNIFFILGNHLYNNINYLIDDKIFNKNKKTYDEYKKNYIDKLFEQNKLLNNNKKELLNKIDNLTSINKNISDEIKVDKNKLNNNSFYGYFNKDIIIKNINDNNKLYNINFEIITENYEDIVKIDECIKKNNNYMKIYIN